MRLSAAMIENIRLRVSPEEKRSLRAAASRRGLSLSEYVRETATSAAQIVEAT